MSAKIIPWVKVGQVWEDNDYRSRGRRIKVERVEPEGFCREAYAVCSVISSPLPHTVGRTTYIALRRFRPNSTGYRLVEDVG